MAYISVLALRCKELDASEASTLVLRTQGICDMCYCMHLEEASKSGDVIIADVS